MALSDWYSNLNLLLRWLHVISAITWLGHLYFFNFVNIPLQAALDDAGKKAVNSKLLPRALWWFRWSAMATLVFGLILFMMNYMYTPGVGFGPSSLMRDAEGITARAAWIMFGMTVAVIMWVHVWFVVWPAQKKMLAGKATTEELPALRRRVLMASRTNAYLSGPMLFGMLAPSHYGAFNIVTLLVAIAIGVLAIWWAIKTSDSAGSSV